MGFTAALARQKLRDAAKLQQQDAAAEKEMRPAVTHASRAPAFLREALRRDRDDVPLQPLSLTLSTLP